MVEEILRNRADEERSEAMTQVLVRLNEERKDSFLKY